MNAPSHSFAAFYGGSLGQPHKPMTLDAHEVCKFLDQNLTVKQGMLGSCNFMIYRVTIYDRDNWEDVLRAELPILESKLGEKIGIIGDQRIVGLDDNGKTANGKVAVHLTYRAEYAAHKLTILALVKA